MKNKNFPTTVDYGYCFYKQDSLVFWAKKYLKLLPNDVGTLVSSGSSGCAIASAMLVLSKRPLLHVYVQKQGEKSHDGAINHTYTSAKARISAIVDDFSQNGNTIRHIVKQINENTSLNIKYILITNTHNHLKKSLINMIVEVKNT